MRSGQTIQSWTDQALVMSSVWAPGAKQGSNPQPRAGGAHLPSYCSLNPKIQLYLAWMWWENGSKGRCTVQPSSTIPLHDHLLLKLFQKGYQHRRRGRITECWCLLWRQLESSATCRQLHRNYEAAQDGRQHCCVLFFAVFWEAASRGLFISAVSGKRFDWLLPQSTLNFFSERWEYFGCIGILEAFQDQPEKWASSWKGEGKAKALVLLWETSLTLGW